MAALLLKRDSDVSNGIQFVICLRSDSKIIRGLHCELQMQASYETAQPIKEH